MIDAWLSRRATVIAWIVPGGPASLGVVAGLIAGLMLAAFLAIPGFDRLFQTLDQPPGQYYGVKLSGIDPVGLPSRAWAYVSLAVCLAVHLGAVWVDRSRARQASPA